MTIRLPLAAAFVFLLAAAPAHAQPSQRETPQSRQEITLSFAPVVKKAGPAVVNVYGARRQQQTRHPLFDDPFFREFFGGGRAPRERMQQSVGSGVLVASDGIVVTNHHVIEGMSEVKVALPDKREFEAEVLLRDPKTDLAVLKMKGTEKFPLVELGNSDELQVGDLVLAIGNPFGVGQTVTQGIVSALARTQVGVSDYQFFIQTDAAINPGNSGGAMVDMQGRLVGINTAIYSRSGGSHGIGFAIPASMVRVVVDSARSGGKTVRRPWFGARMQSLTAEIAESMGLDRPIGALIASVAKGSPAAQAGVQAGDVVVAVDGATVEDPDGFGFRFATKALGGTSSITVLRSGKRVVLPVKLQSAPETTPRDQRTIAGRSPFSGLVVVNLSPAAADELSLSADAEGVAVADVTPGSPAQQVGFQKGDVLLAINNEPAKTTRDVERLTAARSGFGWRVTVSREGQTLTIILGG